MGQVQERSRYSRCEFRPGSVFKGSVLGGWPPEIGLPPRGSRCGETDRVSLGLAAGLRRLADAEAAVLAVATHDLEDIPPSDAPRGHDHGPDGEGQLREVPKHRV